jgi:FtsZ-binding cell division protein ZapB
MELGAKNYNENRGNTKSLDDESKNFIKRKIKTFVGVIEGLKQEVDEFKKKYSKLVSDHFSAKRSEIAQINTLHEKIREEQKEEVLNIQVKRRKVGE